jgi:hypothetical protein
MRRPALGLVRRGSLLEIPIATCWTPAFAGVTIVAGVPLRCLAAPPTYGLQVPLATFGTNASSPRGGNLTVFPDSALM